MQDITFPIGLGQRFTRKGKPYPTINRPQIEALVESPHSREKADALWFIPSSYSAGWARTHVVQQELGEFWWLTADIDEGSPSIDTVIGSVEAALGDVHMMVYSSSGATPENLKWRVLVPLSEPFAPYDWVDVQTAFFDELEREGLNVDEVLKRAGQLVYCRTFRPAVHFINTVRSKEHAMLSRDQFASNGESLIDRYNSDNPIRAQLLKYGYTQGSSPDEFISPNSRSGHQVKVFGNVATSLSTSDAGVGVEGNGSHNVDSFGLYRFYECENDLNTAITKIAAHYRGVEVSNEPDAPVDPLNGFTFSTAQELSQRHFEPIKWLKPRLLPLPNLALIAGAPKCGKSWFAMGMARDIVSDGNIVVYIANEDNERRLKDRYAKISDFASSNLIFMSGLSSEKSLPKGDAAHQFIRAIKVKYPKLKCIIIDTIQAIRDQNQKDHYGVVEAEFGKLRKLAHELNITIVAVHHTKKKTDFEVEPLDQILGSQAISATVETILILQRVVGSQDIDLFITGKDVVQQDDYRLCWTDAGFSNPQDRTYASLGPIQQEIVKFVKSHPSCTQTAIVEGIGKSKQQVNEALNRPIELGIIKLVEGKKLICLHT